MGRQLTAEELQKLAGALEGTCNEIPRAVEGSLQLDEEDIDLEDAEDRLMDFIERCGGCGWWMESCDLVDEDGDVVGCDQCREQEPKND